MLLFCDEALTILIHVIIHNIFTKLKVIVFFSLNVSLYRNVYIYPLHFDYATVVIQML